MAVKTRGLKVQNSWLMVKLDLCMREVRWTSSNFRDRSTHGKKNQNPPAPIWRPKFTTCRDIIAPMPCLSDLKTDVLKSKYARLSDINLGARITQVGRRI